MNAVVNVLQGLTIPDPLPPGRPSKAAVGAWLDVVEVLIGRGVTRPGELGKLLGVKHSTASRWLDVVRKRWAAGLSAERLNWRRERLYTEAEEVARYAWQQAIDEPRTASKAQLLRIVIEANKRKAALCGLDSQVVDIKTTIEAHTTIDVVARVEADLDLAPGALEAIGRQAALLLSSPPTDTALIDVTPPSEQGG